jgi:hypothetical protein
MCRQRFVLDVHRQLTNCRDVVLMIQLLPEAKVNLPCLGCLAVLRVRLGNLLIVPGHLTNLFRREFFDVFLALFRSTRSVRPNACVQRLIRALTRAGTPEVRRGALGTSNQVIGLNLQKRLATVGDVSSLTSTN